MARAQDRWDRHLSRIVKGTAKNLRRYVNMLLDKHSITLDELYEMQREAEKAEHPFDRDEVIDMVVDFIKDLEDQGYSSGTRRNAVQAFSTLFRVLKCPEFKFPKEFLPEVYNEGQRIITKSQILEAWDQCYGINKLREPFPKTKPS